MQLPRDDLMEKCRFCAGCCQIVLLPMINLSHEMEDFLLRRGFDILVAPNNSVYLKIYQPCPHLIYKNGFYTCNEYDKRPIICQKFQVDGALCALSKVFNHKKQ